MRPMAAGLSVGRANFVGVGPIVGLTGPVSPPSHCVQSLPHTVHEASLYCTAIRYPSEDFV
jgi:hypothetical protein